MKLPMVKLTNRKTNEIVEMSEQKWKKELKRLPALTSTYTVTRFVKNIPSFKFIAWVHPKNGGDDYRVEVDQPAKDIFEAKQSLESWLKTISAVADDYQEVRS